MTFFVHSSATIIAAFCIFRSLYVMFCRLISITQECRISNENKSDYLFDIKKSRFFLKSLGISKKMIIFAGEIYFP